MIAYNPIWLNNLLVRRRATVAFDQGLLDRSSLDNINHNYSSSFYSPNIFIRTGLFILTVVILIFAFGLICLLLLDFIEHAMGEMAVFFAVLSYAGLEYMVRVKKHFKSGVDDALLWIAACFLFGGVSYLTKAGDLDNAIIIFIISLYCTLRFADRLMSLVLYSSLLAIFFFICTETGGAVKAFVPFILLIVSFGTYMLLKKVKLRDSNQFYAGCLHVIAIAAVISFYCSGNYYIVRELSNSLFHLHLTEKQSIPFGWFFWLFTIILPFLYILRGIKRKDLVFLRIGLLLIAATIVTVRYYYAIASIEVSMTAGGVILVFVSCMLNRYLKTTKYGFTKLEPAQVESDTKIRIESILIAQAFSGHAATAEATNFGGGSFSGGGASGEF